MGTVCSDGFKGSHTVDALLTTLSAAGNWPLLSAIAVISWLLFSTMIADWVTVVEAGSSRSYIEEGVSGQLGGGYI